MNRDTNAQGVGPPATGAPEAGAERLGEAWARLCESLAALARDVESRLGERCPYRDREDRCTFIGGCDNQRGAGAAGPARDRFCGGDHALRWERHSGRSG